MRKKPQQFGDTLERFGTYSTFATFENITPKFWDVYDLNDLRDIEKKRKEIIANWETSDRTDRRFAFVIEAHHKDNPDSDVLKRVHGKVHDENLKYERQRLKRSNLD